MNARLILTVLTLAATVAPTPPAAAFEFRTRFVHRVGITDIPIDGDYYATQVPIGGSIRIRVQLGVFDDDAGPAPAGGVLGWNRGSMVLSDFHTAPMVSTRTPGRLAPFTFGVHGNGRPDADPFTDLRDIDNVVGIQSPAWPAGSDPDTPPPPVIYGLNSYVSVYEITLHPTIILYTEWRNIDIEGSGLAASHWNSLFTPIPPTPDEAGSVVYVPIALDPIPFSARLRVQAFTIPAPPAAVLLLLGAAPRRRMRPG